MGGWSKLSLEPTALLQRLKVGERGREGGAVTTAGFKDVT